MSNNPTEKRFTRVSIPVGSERVSPWQERKIWADGLLFESDPTDRADLNAIVRDPQLVDLFGGLLVIDNDDRLTVHGEVRALPTPDKAQPDTAVHYVKDGVLKSFKIVQRFLQCTDPVRDLLGCEECSSRGLPCISGVAHGEVNGELAAAIGESSARRDLTSLKDNKTHIGGHRFVSPVLLAETSETFVKGDRQPRDIDWSAEEDRRRMRRSASNAATLTRQFKKTECSGCIAREGGCQAWRNCPGAYEGAETHTKIALEKWLPVLDGTPAAGGLQLWQLYAVMHHAGDEGRGRWHRREVVLGGLVEAKGRLTVRVAARRRPADERYVLTDDWEKLRAVFPRLPEKDGDPGTSRPPDADLALYFAAVDAHRFGPELRGFQGYQSDGIGHLSVFARGGIWVERARNWGIRPGVHGYNGTDVTDWVSFYRTFRSLPGKRRRSRPEVYYGD